MPNTVNWLWLSPSDFQKHSVCFKYREFSGASKHSLKVPKTPEKNSYPTALNIFEI